MTAGYDAKSAVEHELELRLASVLWRLRRTTGIETALFEAVADDPSKRALIPASRQATGVAFPCAIDTSI